MVDFVNRERKLLVLVKWRTILHGSLYVYPPLFPDLTLVAPRFNEYVNNKLF